MTAVLSEIERQKRLEQARQWDTNEKAIIGRLQPFSQRPLTERETLVLNPFLRWCQQNGVRHCPVKPGVLAAYVTDQEYKTEPVETLLAIERLHDIHNLPNPVTTAVVRAALAPLIDDEPPRSWSLGEKAKFYDAPVEVREIIARRSQQRETAFSRVQNEVAELRKKLNAESKTEGTPASNGVEHIKGTERASEPNRAGAG